LHTVQFVYVSCQCCILLLNGTAFGHFLLQLGTDR
jgi:hypothetical protein